MAISGFPKMTTTTERLENSAYVINVSRDRELGWAIFVRYTGAAELYCFS
jgi:hypothetical protein